MYASPLSMQYAVASSELVKEFHFTADCLLNKRHFPRIPLISSPNLSQIFAVNPMDLHLYDKVV
jgi:hypothetical protein